MLTRDYSPLPLPCPVAPLLPLLHTLAAVFAEADQDRLDGLTVDFGRRWLNLRPSNTEPVLRLNVEAEDSAAVAALVESVRSVIEEG